MLGGRSLRVGEAGSLTRRKKIEYALIFLAVVGFIVGSVWLVRIIYLSRLEPTACLADLLRCTGPIFKKHKVDIWLDAGSLLGAIRHGGMIPWDDPPDLDMMVLESQAGEPLKAVLEEIRRECGFPAIHRDEQWWLPPWTSYVVRKNVARVFWGRGVPIYLDVADTHLVKDLSAYHPFGFKFTEEEVMDGVYADLSFPIHYQTPIPHNYIFPLKPCIFEGVETQCPARSEDVLNLLFGSDWRIPQQGKKPIH